VKEAKHPLSLIKYSLHSPVSREEKEKEDQRSEEIL